ncbi:anti-sigma factor [Nocardioides mangrovicus]|uniref:Regulator of SigK n=1 Tax=Nocardioides mangrovicus TaxID=2478913 RepID=A0A3L8NWJ6_9ACTN|nr:anti-sigma factor [Nocardioides mangrovicus]RLV47525.1 anti-sigma factor [Nocardioides mangrovicus]
MSDLHPLSGAYAVDALDDVERARFERHLKECDDCAAEVTSLREAAGLLALTADPTPSPEMRERVLAQVHTVRPLPPVATQVEVVRRRWARFPQLVAAAVAAFVVVAGGVGVSALHPFRQDQAPVAGSVVQQVLQAQDSRNQAVDVGEGRATLYHSKSVGRAVLVTKDMPATPTGRTYELWFKKNGHFVPAGLMTASGNQTFVLHGGLGDATDVGVTIEPTGGSKRPTSAPVAYFDLAKSV